MPKIMIGGVVREMTPEEDAQWKQEMANLPKPEPSPEQRMTEIEAALIELAAMMAGGV